MAVRMPESATLDQLHLVLAWAVAWFAGERTRLRGAHIAELTERADRAEREAEGDRLLAVAEERNRIARDLHDSAGHAINVIAVRAGAARLRHRQEPERSITALVDIEDLARRTAGDIDSFVGALRDGDASDMVEAPTGLASLSTLIACSGAAGLEVDLARSGTARQLEAASDQAAYRILQEALTNAARHGSGRARVELAFGDAALEMKVTNPVAMAPPARSGGGHGIIGMRERAASVGGELVAQDANGAYCLTAVIPYRSWRR